MLKVLVKKQVQEVFRSYFYDQKKNKARSKGGVIGMFILFAVLMVGVLGGMFTYLSLSICEVMVEAGIPWLYFAILGLISVFLGAFGSVFNTFSGLYLSKDNDLLLSMPIPERSIVAARLVSVYLLGLLYSAVVSVPTVIVYWVCAGLGAATVIGGLLYIFDISLFVTILSCMLGWVVAKISLKLKHKSIVTVLASLVFITAYYIMYFKAQSLIQDLIANAALYGEIVRSKVYPLYMFGNAGAGDGVSLFIVTALVCAAAAVIWWVLEKTFLKIVTASGSSSRVEYKETRAREKSPASALLGKELALFTGNATYMLNCGLGVLLLPALAVFLLLKGSMFTALFTEMFDERPGTPIIIFTGMFCLVSSMNTMAAPSISLESKNLWISRSLPVGGLQVLMAKVKAHVLLTAVPAVLSAAFVAFAFAGDVLTGLLMVFSVAAFVVCSAWISLLFGLTMPVMNWTNPIAPIKQSLGVLLAMLVPAILAGAVAGLYLWQGYHCGVTLFLALSAMLYAAIAILLCRWTRRRGATLFNCF